MAYADTLKIFETLREKFDEPKAKAIASAVETALESNNNDMLRAIATKTDLAELKSDLIRWMFMFRLGQFASFAAVLFMFFKR